jgi:hypothetical protein
MNCLIASPIRYGQQSIHLKAPNQLVSRVIRFRIDGNDRIPDSAPYQATQCCGVLEIIHHVGPHENADPVGAVPDDKVRGGHKPTSYRDRSSECRKPIIW